MNLYSLNGNVVAAANYLSMSTPILAYALISGSDMAITQLFGHSTAPAQSASSSTAKDMSQGNTSMGNTNMDNASYSNVNANKSNARFDYTSGSASFNRVSGSGTVSNVGGSTIVSSTADQQHLGMDINFNKMGQDQISNMRSQLHSEMGTNSQAWQQVTADGHNISSGQSSQLSKAFASDQTMGRDYTHTKSLATDIQASLNAVGNGVAMSVDAKAKLEEKIDELSSISQRYANNKDSAVADTFSHMQNFAASSQKVSSASWNLQQAETRMQSEGYGLKVTGNDAFVQWAAKHGYSGKDIADMSHNANGHSQQEQLQLGNQFVKEWLTGGLSTNSGNFEAQGPNKVQAMAEISGMAGKNAVMPSNNTTSQSGQVEDKFKEQSPSFEKGGEMLNQSLDPSKGANSSKMLGNLMGDTGNMAAGVVPSRDDSVENKDFTQKQMEYIKEHSNKPILIPTNEQIIKNNS